MRGRGVLSRILKKVDQYGGLALRKKEFIRNKIWPIGRAEKQLPVPGESFSFNGRPAFVIPQKKPPAKTPGKTSVPWVFYAPTLPGLPDDGERWMFNQFQARGIAVAGIDVGESSGNPWGRALYSQFHDYLVTSRGFSPKACLMARSRGGLMLYNWAAENPGLVACIAGIYPVCSIVSSPGIPIAAAAYGMSQQEFVDTLEMHNPVDRFQGLAKANVPIFHIQGDDDPILPLAENSLELYHRYAALGGPMTLVVARGQGHTMWNGFFQCRALVNFVIAHAFQR